MLVFIELVWGGGGFLEAFGTAIWVLFNAEFFLRLLLAPSKLTFLRRNWLTVIALFVPALRLFRIFRVLQLAQAARGFRLVRIIGTANRGMNAFRRSLGRCRLGFVMAAMSLVILLGAAGMLAIEPQGYTGYADALSWTAMLVTSIGTDFWPQSGEGRFLAFLIALFGFAVFGYITASFASFFVGEEARSTESEVAGSSELVALRAEIVLLRKDLERQAQSELRRADKNQLGPAS